MKVLAQLAQCDKEEDILLYKLKEVVDAVPQQVEEALTSR